MPTIDSFEDALELWRRFYVPQDLIEPKAAAVADRQMGRIDQGLESFGDVCGHYGGDFWLKIGSG